MIAPPFRLQEATTDDVHSAFRAGESTCRGPVGLYLARIEAYDKGGPVLVKDQAETAGVRTTPGSVTFEDHVPEEDATEVRRSKEAVVLAKTNLPDFATSRFAYSSAGGVTGNPYDLDRNPGGSSGGTGTAASANLGAVGIGEDTQGSMRPPASFDNLVGVKATTGSISRKDLSRLVVFQDTAGRRELDDWKWTVLRFPTNALIADQDGPLRLAHAYEMAASPPGVPESAATPGQATIGRPRYSRRPARLTTP